MSDARISSALVIRSDTSLITGASDDDPSGIATYASVGASLGYATLWMAPVTFPLMATVQYICAKIGMVSGMGLAGVLRQHYGKKLLYPAVLMLVDAWLAPDYRYFKLHGTDGNTYLVRHDEESGVWELTLFRAKSVSA